MPVALPVSSCSRQTNPGLRSARALTGSRFSRRSSMRGSSIGARSRPTFSWARCTPGVWRVLLRDAAPEDRRLRAGAVLVARRPAALASRRQGGEVVLVGGRLDEEGAAVDPSPFTVQPEGPDVGVAGQAPVGVGHEVVAAGVGDGDVPLVAGLL